ncbi:MAG TPA: RHS repeat-associated core domain-containing protein [Pyrinomonadaceae bacterium]
MLLVTAEPAPIVGTNVALAANGATGTASSTWSNPPYSYLASSINNGDHRGLNAGNNSNWTSNGTSLPQWVEVAFNGSRTINEIYVFSLQDNYANPIEPTEATTFSLYGLTSFEVQYWTGSAWATVPGGSVTGNNKVWKKITFAPLATTKIRVLITATSDGWSRIVEVEAWTPARDNINWLITDQLGTSRIIIDKTGSLANVKRHDYLPFGEELMSGIGSRAPSLGYGTGDGVRQQFTSKERDTETGLDYFGARYYGSTQARFTSADPLYIEMGRLGDPQQFNLYAYTRNNPLKFIDPLGLDIEVTGTEQEAYRKRLQQNVSFQTQINSKTNKVEIVDATGNVLDKKQLKALGKTLKGGEKELFNAITDTKHHVSIETGRNDSGVFFGAFGGGGKQKLDFGDIDLLDAPKNAGGFSAQQAVGHETLEAYSASKGKGFNDAHAYANKFFGGLDQPTTQGTPIFDANGANLTGVRADFPVVGKPGVNARVTMQFVTPIPASAINTMFQTGQRAPVHVIDVEKKP